MSISLSQGIRNAVYSLGDIQSQIDTSNKRLATGRKVNSALDNARAFFSAQGFSKESRDVSALLDGFDNGLRVVRKSLEAVNGIRKLIESAQALARSAQSLATTDTAGRDAYGAQAAELLAQASRLGFDAGHNGNTLLQVNATVPANTEVITNTAILAAAQTKITLKATDIRFSAATGIGAAALVAATHGLAAVAVANAPENVTYTAGDWVGANATRVDAFIAYAGTALVSLQARAATLATQSSAIEIRQGFSKDWVRNVSEAADFLTLADINEEGANLTALQTKQQLSVQALSLAGRADQAILRLF
jgi:flagellin-like hook-associated protein FlgL